MRLAKQNTVHEHRVQVPCRCSRLILKAASQSQKANREVPQERKTKAQR